jgi:peroxiredoxin
LRAAEEKYGEDLVVLLIDEEEGSAAVQGFAERHNLNSVIAMDMTGKIGREYQLLSTPTTFFIDANGVIQNIQAGVITLDWVDNQMAAISQ